MEHSDTGCRDDEQTSQHLARQELEVLQVIYPDAIEIHTTNDDDDDDPDPVTVAYTLCSTVTAGATTTCTQHKLYLHVRVPVGYPEHAAVRVRVLGDDMARDAREHLTDALTAQAERSIGTEVMLELIQELQRQQQCMMLEDEQPSTAAAAAAEDQPEMDSDNAKRSDDTDEALGRAWIWVHHITNANRRKDIVSEATTRNLHGCLKVGYPGIVLIEGHQCDDFITWIKGNKSRPDGGFGRQWGHHVRGQLVLEGDNERRLAESAFYVFDNMKDVGAYTQQHGLQDEFRAYVLQHHT